MSAVTCLKEVVRKTLFLAKNTAFLGTYFSAIEGGFLVSFSGKPYLNFQGRSFIKRQAYDVSSKSYFQKSISEDDLGEDLISWMYLWSQEPYEWMEGIPEDISRLSNPFYLFRRYSNKNTQKAFFRISGNKMLKDQIKWQMKRFDEHVIIGANEKFKDNDLEVMLFHRGHSEGGAGIFTSREASCWRNAVIPILCNKFCDFQHGISQMAVVLKDAILPLPPSRVWNGKVGSPFGAACTYYDPEIGSYCDIEKISALTKSIGETLRKVGFRGAYGVDYLYDTVTSNIFICECNLRYTADVALFCQGTSELSGPENVSHIHSLCILSFLGASISDLPDLGETYLQPLEIFGGSSLKAYFEPNSFTCPKEKKVTNDLTMVDRPSDHWLTTAVNAIGLEQLGQPF